MVNELLGWREMGLHLTNPWRVVVCGAPNVGKSSLFNALMQRNGALPGSDFNRTTPALVSPQRGTTRDYLSATIEINGVRCELDLPADLWTVDLDTGQMTQVLHNLFVNAAQIFAKDADRRQQATDAQMNDEQEVMPACRARCL